MGELSPTLALYLGSRKVDNNPISRSTIYVFDDNALKRTWIFFAFDTVRPGFPCCLQDSDRWQSLLSPVQAIAPLFYPCIE